MMHLNQKDCDSYYCNQLGGGGPYFHGINHQRGYGFFGGIARFLRPIAFAAGKYFGKKLLKTGGNVMSDVAGGRSLKESAKSRFRETGKNIKDDFVRKLQSGSGIKRKRTKQCHQTKTKRRKTTSRQNKGKTRKSTAKDIFS